MVTSCRAQDARRRSTLWAGELDRSVHRGANRRSFVGVDTLITCASVGVSARTTEWRGGAGTPALGGVCRVLCVISRDLYPPGYVDGMGRSAWILVMLCACGEPILKNAPKPDPGAVAGVAAAAAAAATLASPDSAAKKQEQANKGEPDNRGVPVKETVPADVFDRLDSRANDAGVDGAAPSAPSPVPPAQPVH
jgi:hypothetical protein